MAWLNRLKWWGKAESEVVAHRHGKRGEDAARSYLEKNGLRFLMANYSAGRGEIDLIFQDGDCLVFVEVKSRGVGGWTRPAAAVNKRKKRLLTLSALDYLRELKNPEIKIRFDIVEVLLEGGSIHEVRHLPNTFSMSPPFRYG